MSGMELRSFISENPNNPQAQAELERRLESERKDGNNNPGYTNWG